VEEEKSSDVFATEQENSSDYLSLKEAESEQDQNWADSVKIAFTAQGSRVIDGALWLCEGIYYVLIYILLVPVAVLGLIFDELRHLLRKVSAKMDLTLQCPSKLKFRRWRQEVYTADIDSRKKIPL
jgi:hypothetical protein